MKCAPKEDNGTALENANGGYQVGAALSLLLREITHFLSLSPSLAL